MTNSAIYLDNNFANILELLQSENPNITIEDTLFTNEINASVGNI